ncbi:MAG: deoxyribodipyrimidine photo-lyase [Chloroflexi bacterium]|nr:deoxyribodipyrimidine photo-lyase [Chloroflexota bacterium]
MVDHLVMHSSVAVAWFRRDLRVVDNPALLAALASAGAVVPLFVRDPSILGGSRASDRRNAWLEAALASLDADLRTLGGRLVVREGDPREVVPELAREVGASMVHAQRDYTPFARSRDAAVADAVDLRLHQGLLLAEPEEIGDVKVFAAFHRRFAAGPLRAPLPAPDRVVAPDGVAGIPPDTAPAAGALEASTAAALARLHAFAARADRYATDRDRLDVDGSSRLSVHLHFGTVSPAMVAAEVEDDAFRRQLAWRDWAHHLVWWRPEAVGAAWREDLRDLRWDDDPALFSAWAEGRTGYPVVDAAMRQLAAEGFMPNRARMIAASFLAKDLFLDWREGERHFLRQLLDGDVAANAMGWQWVAGVGTDAAPYFRVFNPVLQGRRFDPAGTWVRRWVPEIAELPAAHVHAPWQAPGGPPRGYPPPIVDHAQARARAIARYLGRER